jgi:hypothetical protein
VAPRPGCGGAPPRTPAPDAGDGVGDSGVLRHARRRLTPSRLLVSLRLPHWPASPSFSGGRAATFEGRGRRRQVHLAPPRTSVAAVSVLQPTVLEGRGRYISLRRARRRLSLTPTVLAVYIASPAQVSWLSIYPKHTGHGLRSQFHVALTVCSRNFIRSFIVTAVAVTVCRHNCIRSVGVGPLAD